MIDTQEWQQENSNRAFPFSDSILSQSGFIPLDFIVDAKFTPDRWSNFDAFISSVSYSQVTSYYTITLDYCSDLTQAIQISISSSVDQIGRPWCILGGAPNEYSILSITPGPSWDPEIWIKVVGSYNSGDETYVVNFGANQSKLDDSIVNPGPNTIRRIFIQPTPNGTTIVPDIPPIEDWGREVNQTIIGGYNISISNDANDPNMIILDAIPGAGSGYVPEDVSGDLLWLNNTSSSGIAGAVSLVTQDCLAHIENPTTNQNVPIPNTVQLISNCLPCCSCENYRAVSAAISRRSAKLKAICDLLSNMVVANAALYNQAVQKINADRIAIVNVRNLRVYPNYFQVSVQNVCNVPVYIHFCVSVSTGSDSSQFSLVELINVVSDPSSLPPLVATSKDYINLAPKIPSGDLSFVTNQSVNPGGYQNFTFYHNTSGTVDLRELGITVNTQANGIYGEQKTYGCSLDNYSATIVPAPDIVTSNCGAPTTIQAWQIKQLVP